MTTAISKKTEPKSSTEVTLYPYQQEARVAIEGKWQHGKRTLILSMPTGSGKTVTFATILRDMIEGTTQRGLIIAHRDELIAQTCKAIKKKVWPQANVTVIDADNKDFDGQILVASVQTITKKKNLAQLPEIGYLITDEGHHSYARSYRAIYNSVAALNPKYCHLGATATPIRTKKEESLSEIFDEIGYSVSIFKLIAEGFLSDIEGYAIKTALDLSNVKVRKDDYEIKGLSKAVSKGGFNESVVQGYITKANKKKAICFAVDIDHVEQLTYAFKDRKINARAVHGKMDKADRKQIIKDFGLGKFKVLVNCMIATEGFDDTATECIIVARPTKSVGLYTQMVGRGLRLHPGKTHCTLLDFTESGSTTGIMSLKDLIAFYDMPTTSKAVRDYATEDRPIIIDKHTIAGFRMLEEIGESKAIDNLDLFNLNDFAWSEYDGNHYVALRKNMSIAIKKEQDTDEESLYSVYLCHTAKGNIWAVRLNEELTTYDMALGTCNVMLYEYGDKTFARKETEWRKKDPSIEQKNYMHSIYRYYKQAIPQTTYHPVRAKTSGECSSFINAAKTITAVADPSTHIPREGLHERIMQIVLSDHIPGITLQQQEAPGPKLRLYGSLNHDSTAKMTTVAAMLKQGDSEFPYKFICNASISIEPTTITIHRGKHPNFPLTDKQKAFLMSRITPAVKYKFPSHTLIITG